MCKSLFYLHLSFHFRFKVLVFNTCFSGVPLRSAYRRQGRAIRSCPAEIRRHAASIPHVSQHDGQCVMLNDSMFSLFYFLLNVLCI